MELTVAGAYTVDIDFARDQRGGFGRAWCRDEFAERGLDASLAQVSISTNDKARTLRGLHLQTGQNAEVKLVRCTRGSAYDVVLDLREGSPTHRQWAAVTISADNHSAVYVPAGVAHGFLTLEDHTELLYQISVPYEPGAATGVRWNDPTVAIAWPAEPLVVSERDAELPFLRATS